MSRNRENIIICISRAFINPSILKMTIFYALFYSIISSAYEAPSIFTDKFDIPSEASKQWLNIIKSKANVERPVIFKKKVKFVDGVVEITNTTLYTLRQDFKDSVVEFEFMMKSGKNHGRHVAMGGFIVHNHNLPGRNKQPGDRQLGLIFRLKNKIPNYLVKGGINEKSFGFEKLKMPTMKLGQWYKLKLSISKQVKVELNGIVIGSTTKAPNAIFNRCGGFGLRAYNSTVCFRNIKIQALSKNNDLNHKSTQNEWLGKDGKPKTKLRGFTVTVGDTGRAAKDNISFSDLEDMKKDWNANLVRFMMRKTAYQSFVKDFEAGREPKIVKWLNKARELGITPIIDLHYSPQKQSEIDFYAAKWQKGLSKAKLTKLKHDSFWDNKSSWEAVIKFWTYMAKVCKDRPEEVWFDLKNEPVCWRDMPSYPKKWPALAQKIIDSVRAVNKKDPIVIEPGPGGLCWGFKNFPALKGENIIYSVHQYEPHGYSHQALGDVIRKRPAPKKMRNWPGNYPENNGYWDKDRLRDLLAPVVAFQKKHNVRIYVGEFGVVKWAPNSVSFLKDNIDLFEEYGWDWTLHIFRSSIPVFELEASDGFDKIGKLENALIKPPKFTGRGKLIKKYFSRNINKKTKREVRYE